MLHSSIRTFEFCHASVKLLSEGGVMFSRTAEHIFSSNAFAMQKPLSGQAYPTNPNVNVNDLETYLHRFLVIQNNLSQELLGIATPIWSDVYGGGLEKNIFSHAWDVQTRLLKRLDDFGQMPETNPAGSDLSMAPIKLAIKSVRLNFAAGMQATEGIAALTAELNQLRRQSIPHDLRHSC